MGTVLNLGAWCEDMCRQREGRKKSGTYYPMKEWIFVITQYSADKRRGEKGVALPYEGRPGYKDG